MYCKKCGKELDANNVCINPDCPSNKIEEGNKSDPKPKNFGNPWDNTPSSNNFGNPWDNQSQNSSSNNSLNQNPWQQSNSFDLNNDNGFTPGNTLGEDNGFTPGAPLGGDSIDIISSNLNQNNNFNSSNNLNQNNSFNSDNGFNSINGLNFNNEFNSNSSFNTNNDFNSNNGFNLNNGYSPYDVVDKSGIYSSDMSDFLGYKNTDYYMEKWMEFQKNPKFLSWNWPAFFFSYAWFCYRKMYAVVGIYIAIGQVLPLILMPLVFLKMPALCLIVILGVRLSMPILANQLYMKHATTKITSIKALYQSQGRNVVSQKLEKAGGTSWVVILVVLGIYAVFIAILFSIVFESIATAPRF